MRADYNPMWLIGSRGQTSTRLAGEHRLAHQRHQVAAAQQLSQPADRQANGFRCSRAKVQLRNGLDCQALARRMLDLRA
jgi:hypothetical protein